MELKKIFLTFFSAIIFLAVCAQKRPPVVSPGEGNNAFVKFAENKGQWDSNVLYRAQLDGGVLFLEKNCFTYSFYEKEKLRKLHASAENLSAEERQIHEHAFRVTLKNSLNPEAVNSLY